MTPERLSSLIEKFSSRCIAVIGDFFLDKYLETDPSLVISSYETNKIAHQVVKIRHSPGGAGNIVCNLKSLGAGTVYAVGFTGDDGEGFELRRDLTEWGCVTEGLLKVPGRFTPSYLKPRDKSVPGLQGEHNRYDIINRKQTGKEIEKDIISRLDDILPRIDAVIIADQVIDEDCGVITPAVRDILAERAVRFPEVIFWADSRTHIRLFRNIIIKPNQFEAMGIKSPQPHETVNEKELFKKIVQLRSEVNNAVCITRGASGSLVSDPEPTAVPGLYIEGPLDITGAGDSMASGAVLALSSGASFPEAALTGNLTASVTIQQLDTTGTAKPEDLPPQLELWHSQGNAIKPVNL